MSKLRAKHDLGTAATALLIAGLSFGCQAIVTDDDIQKSALESEETQRLMVALGGDSCELNIEDATVESFSAEGHWLVAHAFATAVDCHGNGGVLIVALDEHMNNVLATAAVQGHGEKPFATVSDETVVWEGLDGYVSRLGGLLTERSATYLLSSSGEGNRPSFASNDLSESGALMASAPVAMQRLSCEECMAYALEKAQREIDACSSPMRSALGGIGTLNPLGKFVTGLIDGAGCTLNLWNGGSTVPTDIETNEEAYEYCCSGAETCEDSCRQPAACSAENDAFCLTCTAVSLSGGGSVRLCCDESMSCASTLLEPGLH